MHKVAISGALSFIVAVMDTWIALMVTMKITAVLSDLHKLVDTQKFTIPISISASCGRSEFTCVKSGRCIASSKRCDGNVDDCQDGINLDEIGCLRNESNYNNIINFPLAQWIKCLIACLGKFPCDSPQTVSALGHSTCVELHLFCDGKNDCPGGEDELTCSSYGRLRMDCLRIEFKYFLKIARY